MGITPSNNNRLMENFYRHQMLQRDESNIGREKLSLLAGDHYFLYSRDNMFTCYIR